jgi:hypothetical protein
MNNKFVLIYAIFVLTSCGSSPGSSSSLGDFEINGLPFLASKNGRKMTTSTTRGITLIVDPANNITDISLVQRLRIYYHSKDSITSDVAGTYSGPCWTGYNKSGSQILSKSGSSNIAKQVTVVKNSNGTYTVNGSYLVYQHSDLTKPYSIKVHFTTDL